MSYKYIIYQYNSHNVRLYNSMRQPPGFHCTINHDSLYAHMCTKFTSCQVLQFDFLIPLCFHCTINHDNCMHISFVYSLHLVRLYNSICQPPRFHCIINHDNCMYTCVHNSNPVRFYSTIFQPTVSTAKSVTINHIMHGSMMDMVSTQGCTCRF